MYLHRLISFRIFNLVLKVLFYYDFANIADNTFSLSCYMFLCQRLYLRNYRISKVADVHVNSSKNETAFTSLRTLLHTFTDNQEVY